MDYLGLANGNLEEKLIAFGDGACFGLEKSGAEKSQERTEKKWDVLRTAEKSCPKAEKSWNEQKSSEEQPRTEINQIS